MNQYESDKIAWSLFLKLDTLFRRGMVSAIIDVSFSATAEGFKASDDTCNNIFSGLIANAGTYCKGNTFLLLLFFIMRRYALYILSASSIKWPNRTGAITALSDCPSIMSNRHDILEI